MSTEQQQPIQLQDNTVPEQEAPKVEPLKGDESNEEVARRLSAIIDNANERVKPMLEMMKEVIPI